MGIQFNIATPSPVGGMAGIETPRGTRGQRIFKACKGTATRAALSVSRMIRGIIHPRSRNVRVVGTQTSTPPRASIRKLDFSALHAGRSPGLQPSPGAVSSRSMPNCVLRGRPDTPSPTSPPIEGVRLKPGRVAGNPPNHKPVPDGPPPLPARPPGLGNPFATSRFSPSTPCIVAGDERPTPPPRSETPDPARTEPPASMPVFHRANPAGPITTAVGGAAPSTPPGNGEPLR